MNYEKQSSFWFTHSWWQFLFLIHSSLDFLSSYWRVIMCVYHMAFKLSIIHLFHFCSISNGQLFSWKLIMVLGMQHMYSGRYYNIFHRIDIYMSFCMDVRSKLSLRFSFVLKFILSIFGQMIFICSLEQVYCCWKEQVPEEVVWKSTFNYIFK